MKKTLLLIPALILLIAFILFHDYGNVLLKPYLSSYLESKIKNRIDINVQELKIDVDQIEFTARLNDMAQIKVQGEISFLSEKLDVKYQLHTNKIEAFKGKIDIHGTAKGKFDNIYVKGKGDAFTSTLIYNFTLKEDIMHLLRVDLDRANIEELLSVTGQPPYAKGEIDIHMVIPRFDKTPSRSNGRVAINLHSTILDEKILQKEFNLSIPPLTTLTARINSHLQDNLINLNGRIDSNLGKLFFKKTQYNVKTKTLESKYLVKIRKLEALQEIIKKELYGELSVRGHVSYQYRKEESLILTGLTKSLDGELDFKLKENIVSANIENISIPKLMRMFNYPETFKGHLFGEGEYNFSTKKGNITTELNQAQLLANKVTELIKKEEGIDLSREKYNRSTFSANIDNREIIFEFTAKSKDSKIFLHHARIDRKAQTIHANYMLNIYDQDISGTLNGDINNPTVTVNTLEFMKNEFRDAIAEEIEMRKEDKKIMDQMFKGFF